jgi:hypothetical protein
MYGLATWYTVHMKCPDSENGPSNVHISIEKEKLSGVEWLGEEVRTVAQPSVFTSPRIRFIAMTFSSRESFGPIRCASK